MEEKIWEVNKLDKDKVLEWFREGKGERPTTDETYKVLSNRSTPIRDEETLEEIWNEEVEKAGIFTPIPFEVSLREHQAHRQSEYADATYYGSPNLPFPYYRVIFHPFLLFTEEDYTRKVMRHEISHIKSDAKRRKITREALGL